MNKPVVILALLITLLLPTAGFAAVPGIAMVSPNTDTPAGGTPLTINGSGFTGATLVTIGGVAVGFTVNTNEQITATTPAKTPVMPGLNNAVVVTGPEGTSNSAFFSYLAPQISAITPGSGSIAGGTTVTISGSYLTGASTVRFGATEAATFSVNSDGQITATSPTAAAGTVSVSVVATDQISNLLSFTYDLTSAASIVLASNPNPAASLQTVTFTATVTPADAIGTVTFMNGTSFLGSGMLSGGIASYSTPFLAPGSHSITARYDGDGIYSGSTSDPLIQVINFTAGSGMPTTSDIYNLLAYGTAIPTPDSSSFTEPSSGPASGARRSLAEIQAILPAVDDDNGATAGQVLSGKTFWGLRSDGTWGVKTGTLVPQVRYSGVRTATAADSNLTPANIIPGVTIFGVTGQRTCNGTLNGTRWCDQLNGTVMDMSTGLVWLQDTNCTATLLGVAKAPLPFSTLAWDDARLWSAGLASGTCGLSDRSAMGDWRLPTKNELAGLTIGTEPVLFGTPRVFANIQGHNYWTVSSYTGEMSSAMFVSMIDGIIQFNSKSNSFYHVWPVRSGQ